MDGQALEWGKIPEFLIPALTQIVYTLLSIDQKNPNSIKVYHQLTPTLTSDFGMKIQAVGAVI